MFVFNCQLAFGFINHLGYGFKRNGFPCFSVLSVYFRVRKGRAKEREAAKKSDSLTFWPLEGGEGATKSQPARGDGGLLLVRHDVEHETIGYVHAT